MAVLTFFGNTFLSVATCFGLLCALTPWFWYRWGREIFPTKKLALLFVAIIIYLPSWIGIYGFFQDETLLLPCLGAALWLSWAAKRNKKTSSLFLAALVWGLTLCIKLNGLYEAVIVLPWLFISYIKEQPKQPRRYAVIVAAAAIVVCGYLSQAFWNYHCLGTACLFPPGFSGNNRASYLSGVKEWSETFTRHGKTIWRTGFYQSNSLRSPALQPFSNWLTWREGSLETVIDCDRQLYILIPASYPSWKKYLQIKTESFLHFFFSWSWPDNRIDDLVQNLQADTRWIWSLLTLSCCFLAWRKNQFKNILVVLCLGTALLYIGVDSVILEGRYRKPWEAIVIATFVYLISQSQRQQPSQSKQSSH